MKGIDIGSLFKKLLQSFNNEHPFVVYRYPNSKKIRGIFQKTTTIYYTSDYKEPGFIFAPFDSSKKTVLFPLSNSDFYESDFSPREIKIDQRKSVIPSFTNSSEKAYVKLIQKGIDFLEESQSKKVVLSRALVLNYHNSPVLEIFKKALIHYPNALVYIWYHPLIGLWMGASPEQLVHVENSKFTTMALAGTQSYRCSLDVTWTDKEKYEQQLVTDYIVNKLDQKLKYSEVKTIKAGNLVHLCTLISGSIHSQFSLKTLIEKLHPTPAVCGLPQDKAKLFILKNENYNREFYTGFLGEIHLFNSASVYVNLRCMQVFTEKIKIYIGGGITKESIPINEWQETVEKSKVMLQLL